MKKILLYTVPVMIVYLSLGIAYGILMAQNGYGPLWSFGTSVFVFAGAAQYALAPLLVSQVSPFAVFAFILIINARHVFYGISMLKRYDRTGVKKWYLMFGLTDETFGLLSSLDDSTVDNPDKFYLGVTIFNHLYWVVGSTIGGVLGTLIEIKIVGLEFILVALFVSVFVSQMKKRDLIIPGIIGLCVSFVMLILFQDNFIIPSMIGIILGLILLGHKKR